MSEMSLEKRSEADKLFKAGDKMEAYKQQAFAEALEFASNAHKYGTIES